MPLRHIEVTVLVTYFQARGLETTSRKSFRSPAQINVYVLTEGEVNPKTVTLLTNITSVPSFRSITSLADKEALQDVSGTSRGLWSCLPESARDTLEEMLDLSILKVSLNLLKWVRLWLGIC